MHTLIFIRIGVSKKLISTADFFKGTVLLLGNKIPEFRENRIHTLCFCIGICAGHDITGFCNQRRIPRKCNTVTGFHLPGRSDLFRCRATRTGCYSGSCIADRNAVGFQNELAALVHPHIPSRRACFCCRCSRIGRVSGRSIFLKTGIWSLRGPIIRCHNRILSGIVVAVLLLFSIFVCDSSFAEVSRSGTVCRDSPLEVDKVSAVRGDYDFIPNLLRDRFHIAAIEVVNKEIERHIIFGKNI